MSFKLHLIEEEKELIAESLDSVVEYWMTDDTQLPTQVYAMFEVSGMKYAVVIMQSGNKGIYKVSVGQVPSKNLMLWKINPAHIRPVMATVVRIVESCIPLLGMKAQAYLVRVPPIVKKNYVRLLEKLVARSFIKTMKVIPVDYSDAGEKYLFLARKTANVKELFKTKGFADYNFDAVSSKDSDDPVKPIPSDVGAIGVKIPAEALEIVKDKKPIRKALKTEPSKKYQFTIKGYDVDFEADEIARQIMDKKHDTVDPTPDNKGSKPTNLVGMSANFYRMISEYDTAEFKKEFLKNPSDFLARNLAPLFYEIYKKNEKTVFFENDASDILDCIVGLTLKDEMNYHDMKASFSHMTYAYRIALDETIGDSVYSNASMAIYLNNAFEIFKEKYLSYLGAVQVGEPPSTYEAYINELMKKSNTMNGVDELFAVYMLPYIYFLNLFFGDKFRFTPSFAETVKKLINKFCTETSLHKNTGQTALDFTEIGNQRLYVLYMKMNDLTDEGAAEAMNSGFQIFLKKYKNDLEKLKYDPNVGKNSPSASTSSNAPKHNPAPPKVEVKEKKIDLGIDMSTQFPVTPYLDNPVEVLYKYDSEFANQTLTKLETEYEYSKEFKKLNKDSGHRIKSYTGASYGYMNENLRTLFKTGAISSSDAKDANNKMWSQFAKATPLPDNLFVFRSTSVPKPVWDINENLVDPGFLSTSLSSRRARDFKMTKTFLVIMLPKGSRVIVAGNNSAHPSEKEIILPPMSVLKPYRIAEVNNSYIQDTQVIYCVYVGNAAKSFFEKNKLNEEPLFRGKNMLIEQDEKEESKFAQDAFDDAETILKINQQIANGSLTVDFNKLQKELDASFKKG